MVKESESVLVTAVYQIGVWSRVSNFATSKAIR